jgi:hypothetical protein
MKTIFLLLVFFIIMGVFARSKNRWTQALLSAGIIVVILYLYIG